jgi:hypothetical protein
MEVVKWVGSVFFTENLKIIVVILGNFSDNRK